jgi:hypothetical protein
VTPLVPKFILIVILTGLLPALTLAQTPKNSTPPCKPLTLANEPNHKPIPCRPRHHSDTSISLGAFSQLTIDRTGEMYGFTTQGTAPSAGVLGTFRQTFSPWLGYSVNLGYSRVSEQYRSDSGYYGIPNELNINSNVYETSITYIAHTSVNKRISLFGDIGPGLLTVLPIPGNEYSVVGSPERMALNGLSVQVRPTGVFGSGVDVHLSSHFDFRAEYRGLIYNNPDFRTGDYLSKRVTLTSEPTFSLVYYFHKRKP